MNDEGGVRDPGGGTGDPGGAGDTGVGQLQSFLRAVAAGDREVVRVGPFVAYFDLRDELRYLNYAIPDDGVDPEVAEIDALRAAFAERERLPRLEWIAEASPAVASALAGAGMREELASR